MSMVHKLVDNVPLHSGSGGAAATGTGKQEGNARVRLLVWGWGRRVAKGLQGETRVSVGDLEVFADRRRVA